MIRVFVLFLRRLWLPLLVFAGFSLMCVLVYRHLEGLRWQDALFWMIQPHAIDYQKVRNATKFFSLFVFVGVFAFQIWVAERVLITIFNRQSVEDWRTMINDVNIDKRHDVLEAAGIERARVVCIVIDNDADNLYITVTAKALNPKARIITRAGQARYAQAMRNSGADEVIIPEYEGGLMTGRMISKYYPDAQ